MWLVLSFVVCLNAASGEDRCRTIDLPWAGSMMSCMLRGQAEMARWVMEHPGYEVRGGWECRRGRDI